MGLDLTGIGSVADLAKGIMDRIFPPSLSAAEKAQAQIQLQEILDKRENAIIEAQRSIILAETQGQSWLQRNWRPILMLTIVAIVANNYLIYPYLSLFTEKALVLDFPEKLWSLMTVGVGGYIVGRTGEKIVQSWKGTDLNNV